MPSTNSNILFTHSGGVTSVVNTVASTLADLTLASPKKLYIARFGINGVVSGDYIDAKSIPMSQWDLIQHTPGSSFGSSRIRLPEKIHDFEPIFKHMDQHNIHTFICNGGNNSQILTLKMQQAAVTLGYPLQCIGIPKTIDNDIFHTDTCPGYGSCAKYTATSVLEMSLDLASMCNSGTQVLIYETMGRDTGWIAAASALAKSHEAQGPHIILMPEANFSIPMVLSKIKDCIKAYNHCVICLAEGINDQDNILGGERKNYTYISLYLNQLIQKELKLKTHVVIPDYLQRSSRHIASYIDVQQTKALALHAFKLASTDASGIMVAVKRTNNSPYQWEINDVPLKDVAGRTRTLPLAFVSKDQLFVTKPCLDHIKPLIQGESWPKYKLGLPEYSTLMLEQLQALE